MNVARNLVRAKTGAKRPIAMDPEGTYKKAKEDLAKMVNSENPDKDKKESPCEEKKLSMADTFKQIVETQKVDEGLQDTVDKVTTAAQSGLERMGVKINRTPRGTTTKDMQQKKIEKNVK
jgi:hypothetical protein